MTLIPRVDGLTFFDIDIQWSHAGTCDNYYVAITTDTNYQISFLGFHPPETSSHYVEGSWLYDNVPDFWVVVECRASGDSQEVGQGLPASCSPRQQLGARSVPGARPLNRSPVRGLTDAFGPKSRRGPDSVSGWGRHQR